jgi:hypothetical protein
VVGFIPVDSRARQIGVKLDMENQKAGVWCLLPGRGGQRETAKREAVLS